jgi:hypothetical protein
VAAVVVMAAALALTGAGVATASAGEPGSADQCERPVSARVGNWYCPDPAPTMTGAIRGFATVGAPGYCNSSGCYKRYDDFRADFTSNRGAWGFGPKLLGHEDHEVVWQLAGAEMRARPVFYRNSVATTDVIFTGNLVNAAPGRTGDEIEDTYGVHLAGDVEAGHRQAWLPNGYKSYDTDNFDHVQVMQFSWKLPGYPGYWYSWVKSPNATSANKDIYRFRGVNQLPADPFGGGYNP